MHDFANNKTRHAEEAVIGSLLVNNSCWDDIADILHVTDFESAFHREIYRIITNLLTNGKNADAITISHLLTSRTSNQGFLNLCEIMNTFFTPRNVKAYAENVRQLSIDRQMLKAAQDVMASVHEQQSERLDNAQRLFAGIADKGAKSVTAASEILPAVMVLLEERKDHHGEIRGLPSGFYNLDKITHGLHGGDLTILAGRPSMGKTLLGMNIAEHIALKEKKPVVIFSLEMGKEQLIERSFASVGGVDADHLRSGKLIDSDYEKITKILPAFNDSKLFIDDSSALRVSDIRAKCRRIKREHGLSLIVVDYLSLLAGEGENETLRIGNISRELKLLARDLNVPIIAISQLNRSVEQRSNKRPCMADLRQSGAIEQDADLIIFIYRDEVYDEQTQNKGIAEIIIAKHRNGRVGTIYLKFNNNYCRFENYSGAYINTPRTEQPWRGRSLDY